MWLKLWLKIIQFCLFKHIQNYTQLNIFEKANYIIAIDGYGNIVVVLNHSFQIFPIHSLLLVSLLTLVCVCHIGGKAILSQHHPRACLLPLETFNYFPNVWKCAIPEFVFQKHAFYNDCIQSYRRLWEDFASLSSWQRMMPQFSSCRLLWEEFASLSSWQRMMPPFWLHTMSEVTRGFLSSI